MPGEFRAFGHRYRSAADQEKGQEYGGDKGDEVCGSHRRYSLECVDRSRGGLGTAGTLTRQSRL